MKRFFWILALTCLVGSALAQEERFLNRKAQLPYEGIENIREYLLKRDLKIFQTLKANLADYRKTFQLPKGLAMSDNSLTVNGGKAPSLSSVGGAFISFTIMFNSRFADDYAKPRLLNRGFSPSEFDTLAKMTSGKNEPEAYFRRHLKRVTAELETFGISGSTCGSLIFDVIYFKYVTRALEELSLPSRRAVLAYIFEIRIGSHNRSYDPNCFDLDPETLILAIDQISARDDLKEMSR